MRDLVCIGRKEIIQFFRDAGMLGMHTSLEDSWRIILRWKARYAGMRELFQSLPNGKPMINKSDALVWVQSGKKKVNRAGM